MSILKELSYSLRDNEIYFCLIMPGLSVALRSDGVEEAGRHILCLADECSNNRRLTIRWDNRDRTDSGTDKQHNGENDHRPPTMRSGQRCCERFNRSRMEQVDIDH